MHYLDKAVNLLLFLLLFALMWLMPTRIERLFNSLKSNDFFNDQHHA